MSIAFEISEGQRLLAGLENGTLQTADAYNIASKRDPILVYFILRYLREKYPPHKPESSGVTSRLVELTKTYTDVVQMSKSGEKDPMREWFDDTYGMHEFFNSPEQFVDMIVNKLEG